MKKWVVLGFNWCRENRNLTLSLVLHIALAIFIFVSMDAVVHQVVMPGNVNIVHASVVNMPPKAPSAVKKRAKPKVRTYALKTKHKRRAKPKRKKKKRDLKKLKAQKEKKAKAQKKLKQLKQQALKSIQNSLRANSLAAKATAMRLTEKEKYIAVLAQIIRSNWNNHMQDDDYQVSLKIVQDAAGDVLSVNVVKSSGNPVFDRSAVIAVKKTSPLPQPQDKQLQAQTRVLTLAFST